MHGQSHFRPSSSLIRTETTYTAKTHNYMAYEQMQTPEERMTDTDIKEN